MVNVRGAVIMEMLAYSQGRTERMSTVLPCFSMQK